MYLVAFLQGREVSFWPPKIGGNSLSKKVKSLERNELEDDATQPPGFSLPVIRRGERAVVETDLEISTSGGKSIRIEDVIYGGTGTSIYRATMFPNKKVIIKFYWVGVEDSSQESFLQQFKTEIRASEILKHRNIVKILDRGIYGKFPFIVMEYLAGGTLSDMLRSRDRIPGNSATNIALQLAEAIDFMHKNGVIHRDIKASNILFEKEDINSRVVLGDFGLAKILSEYNQESSNMHTTLGGSPRYMAPEIAEGKTPSTFSDIYSFGVVLYRMLTGKLPFDEKKGVYATLYNKVNNDAPDIRFFRGEISEPIAKRINETLNRDPLMRPKSAKEVLNGIEKDLELL